MKINKLFVVAMFLFGSDFLPLMGMQNIIGHLPFEVGVIKGSFAYIKKWDENEKSLREVVYIPNSKINETTETMFALINYYNACHYSFGHISGYLSNGQMGYHDLNRNKQKVTDPHLKHETLFQLLADKSKDVVMAFIQEENKKEFEQEEEKKE